MEAILAKAARRTEVRKKDASTSAGARALFCSPPPAVQAETTEQRSDRIKKVLAALNSADFLSYFDAACRAAELDLTARELGQTGVGPALVRSPVYNCLTSNQNATWTHRPTTVIPSICQIWLKTKRSK
jgi:hypothetical protein